MLAEFPHNDLSFLLLVLTLRGIYGGVVLQCPLLFKHDDFTSGAKSRINGQDSLLPKWRSQ